MKLTPYIDMRWPRGILKKCFKRSIQKETPHRFFDAGFHHLCCVNHQQTRQAEKTSILLKDCLPSFSLPKTDKLRCKTIRLALCRFSFFRTFQARSPLLQQQKAKYKGEQRNCFDNTDHDKIVCSTFSRFAKRI